LRDKLSLLGIVLLALIAMLVALASLCGTQNVDSHALASSGVSQAINGANAEFKGALKAVREAEAAGADKQRIATLVEQLNSVLRMIDEAESLLLQGNVTEADAMAERTIEISKRIGSDAVELRDEASLITFYDKIFTFGMAPVASLLVTVGTHYGWKWWRRREVERLMRMKIKKVKEPEEEEK